MQFNFIPIPLSYPNIGRIYPLRLELLVAPIKSCQGKIFVNIYTKSWVKCTSYAIKITYLKLHSLLAHYYKDLSPLGGPSAKHPI